MCMVALAALTACGGGDDDNNSPRLTGLAVTTSAHKGERLEPAFDPAVRHYTLRVQSDIFGVLLQPTADGAAAQTSVTAAITAGAYSTTVANTDVAAPEAVPLAQTLGNTGYMVKLSQSYAAYDVEYVQTATVTVADPASGDAANYTVRIVRDNDAAVRARFGAEKVFTSAAGTAIKYHIYYPPNYAASSKTYPVVLALHGVGQRAAGGQPSDMVLKRTKQATIWAQDSEASAAKEAIVIAPQANTAWASSDPTGSLSADGQAAYELLQSVMATEKVDAARIYLTGLSMGGNGALLMAESYPATFAAVFLNAAWAGGANSATVTGADYDWAGIKQHLDGRIRIVAAEDDPDVRHPAYLNLVKQLTDHGIGFQNKLYPSGTFFAPTAHFVWIAGYADAAARDWVFGLKR
jgi:predicted peptidase